MIPDPIEQMENRIDRMVDDLEIVGDTFTCPDCGRHEKLSAALPAGPWPDAMPICRACADPEPSEEGAGE